MFVEILTNIGDMTMILGVTSHHAIDHFTCGHYMIGLARLQRSGYKPEEHAKVAQKDEKKKVLIRRRTGSHDME